MQLPLRYPLTLTFKIMAWSPQFAVRDADGNLVAFVKQKLFKLKEAVTVFADEAQTQTLFTLNADRIIDFSARYHFTDAFGASVGAVQRRGMRSLWRASYDILDGDQVTLTIREENPWIQVADGVLNEIPILGLFSGYLFHPAYLVSRADESAVMRMEKKPAFLESKFTIEKTALLSEVEEKRVLLSLIMLLLLERSRG